MRNPRLHLYHEDARPFLRRTDARYDVIAVDAYRQPYIPFYLTTGSSSSSCATGSRPAACVIVNVGHPEGEDELEKVLTATIGEAFPHVDARPDRATRTRCWWRATAPLSAAASTRGRAAPARRPAPDRERRGAPARPPLRGRRRLHRRQGAGGVAGRQVDRGLREREVSAARGRGDHRRRDRRLRGGRVPDRGGRDGGAVRARRGGRRPRPGATPARSSTRSTRCLTELHLRDARSLPRARRARACRGARRRPDAGLRARGRSSLPSTRSGATVRSSSPRCSDPDELRDVEPARGRRALGVPARDGLSGAARSRPRARSRGAPSPRARASTRARRPGRGSSAAARAACWPPACGARRGAVLVAAGPGRRR